MIGSDRTHEFEAWLTARIASLVQADPKSIAPDAVLTRYGIDSLDAVSLVLDLEEMVGLPLPATLLWDHPTIRKCSAFVAEKAVAARTAEPVVGPGRPGDEAPVRAVEQQQQQQQPANPTERPDGDPVGDVRDVEDVRIERVLFRDLVAFVTRQTQVGSRGAGVPFSPIRAGAHAANPHADADDVALLVAMRGDRCVAYVDLMPALVERDGELKKVCFYNLWYAGEEGRRLGAGGMLLLSSLSLGHDIVGADIDETAEYYIKLRFKPFGPLRYFELGFDRFDLLGMPWQWLRRRLWRRGRRVRALDRLFVACRRLTKAVLYGACWRLLTRGIRDLEFCEVAELPPDATTGDGAGGVRFHRDAATVRWALAHPWWTDRPSEATVGDGFSDYRELFRYVILSVRVAGRTEPLGHVVVSVSGERGETTVKVLDRFVPVADRARVVVGAGLACARRFRADRLHLPEQCASHREGSWLLRFLLRRRDRKYYCYPKPRDSAMPDDLGLIQLDFCDGDVPFM